MIIVLGISEQVGFHRPEIPLEKTQEIDNEARISKKAEMKRKFNRNQKCITPWDIQLSFITFLEISIVNHTNQIKNIDHKENKAASKVKHLEIEADDKLNFNDHINNICKSASNQNSNSTRLKHLLGFQERKLLANVICNVMSKFNFCSLVWNFSSAQSLNKIEKIMKRASRFLLLIRSARKIWLSKYEFKETEKTVHRNL